MKALLTILHLTFEFKRRPLPFLPSQSFSIFIHQLYLLSLFYHLYHLHHPYHFTSSTIFTNLTNCFNYYFNYYSNHLYYLYHVSYLYYFNHYYFRHLYFLNPLFRIVFSVPVTTVFSSVPPHPHLHPPLQYGPEQKKTHELGSE